MTAKTGVNASEATMEAGSAAWPNHWSTPMLVASMTPARITSVVPRASHAVRAERPGKGVDMKAGRVALGRRPRRIIVANAVLALTAAAVASCVAPSATPTPLPSQTIASSPAAIDSPAPTPTSPIWTLWPEVTDPPVISLPTLSPTETPQPTNLASPTPALPKGGLPSVGPLAPGDWTGLRWFAIPGGYGPHVTAPTDTFAPNVNLRGWSGGYLYFVWNDAKKTATPWISANGLNWSAEPALDTSRWIADFEAYAIMVNSDDPSWADGCDLYIDALQEGPNGLLVKAHVVCPAGCGGEWSTPDLMWTSPDAVHWTPVDTWFLGNQRLGDISGGSSGYIALGVDAYSPAWNLWKSAQGQSWSAVTLPAAVTSGGFEVITPVSFGGGFVIASEMSQPQGCAFGEAPRSTPALWWSADGSTWTRDTVPGIARGGYPYLRVDRLSDNLLLARESIWYGSQLELAWVSSDGRNWAPVKNGSVLARMSVVTNGSRGLLYGNGIRTFDANGNPVILKQSGDMPWISDWTVAFGPTGLLITQDGIRYWIGVPTAS